MPSFRTFLALAIGLCLAAAAAAQTPGTPDADGHVHPAPPVKLELAASATEVTLGAEIVLTATMSTERAEGIAVTQLYFDDRSVSFDWKWAGRSWRHTRWSGMVEDPAPLSRGVLKPGEPWKLEVPVVLPQAGTYEVSARWQGHTGEPIVSAALVLTVKPDGENDRLLARFDLEHAGKESSYTVELSPEVAFGTVVSFARLVKDGFYDGTRFHRIIKGFMSQGGDPNTRDAVPENDGTGGPGYSLLGEFDPATFPIIGHESGVLSMARRQHNNSGGSQFFVCSSGARMLDGGYTAFGKIVAGLDVAEAINSVPTKMGAMDRQPSVPVQPVNLVRIALVPGKTAGAPKLLKKR